MNHSHAGHRQRLFDRLTSSGLDSFQPHEVLELLLFFAIPYKDVNELAHRLIDRFGSVKGVFEAPADQLVEMKGIGGRTAEFLHLVRDAVETYLNSPPVEMPEMGRLKNAVAYFRGLFSDVDREAHCMACLNGEDQLIHVTMLDGYPSAGSVMRRAVDAALRHRAFGVVLVHYLPASLPRLTKREIEAVRSFAAMMTAMDITMLDYIALSPDAMHSLRKSGKLQEGSLSLREEPAFNSHWLEDEPVR